MQVLFLCLIVIVGILAIYFSFKHDDKMIYFFIFMVVFQNIVEIIFCKSIPTSYNTVFSVIKELMLYFALFICFVQKNKLVIRKKEICAITLYVIVLCKNMLLTSASMGSAMLALRYMLVPILCITIGRKIKLTPPKMQNLFKVLISVSAFLAVFGLLELLVLGDAFWTSIGYDVYAVKMKGNIELDLINGVTINYYTWDFGGIPIRRLVSITADPLATAYLIYIGVVILITKVVSIKNRSGRFNIRTLMLILLIIASILSLSKAIFVFIAITLLFCAYYYKWMPKSLLRIGTLVVSIVAVLILKSYFYSATSITSSINHLAGLQTGFLNSGIFGQGLGTAGSSVAMLTGGDSGTAESYIGSLVYQIGIIGFGAFMYYIVLQIISLIEFYKKYKSNMTVLSLVLIIGLCICMFFSESAVSIMGTGIYFIIIGITQQEELYKQMEVINYKQSRDFCRKY